MHPPPCRSPQPLPLPYGSAATEQPTLPTPPPLPAKCLVVLRRGERRLAVNAAAKQLLADSGTAQRMLRQTLAALLKEVVRHGRRASCRLQLGADRNFRLVAKPWAKAGDNMGGAICRVASTPATAAAGGRRRSAVDHLPHPVWQVDRQGEVTYVNAAARRLMAREGQDAPARGAMLWPLRWLHPAEAASVRQRWQEALASGGPLHVRCRLNLPPGRGYRWFVVRALARTSVEGGPGGWVVTLQDEQENHEMREDLRTAVGLRNNFLRVASHELSTPLTSLQLALQLALVRINRLAAGEKKLVPVAEPLGRALDDTRRLVELVSDLLDIKRLQAGKFFLRRSRVDLGTVLRDVLARLDKPLQDVGCRVDFCQERAAEGEWDVVRLQQVFFHLLHNVVKYAPGSPLHIRCGMANGDAYVAVEDEGPGIPAGLRKKIFSLFERATEIRGTSGLGLGLYLCRRIVHAHNGHLRLISRQGKGAKFVVILPQVAPAAQAPWSTPALTQEEQAATSTHGSHDPRRNLRPCAPS